MTYERKNIIFYEKISNLGEIVLSIMFFVMEFILTIVSYQFFKNYLIFINRGLFFWGKYCKHFKEFENLSVEKKTLSTALEFEPRSFDCRSTALIANILYNSTV